MCGGVAPQRCVCVRYSVFFFVFKYSTTSSSVSNIYFLTAVDIRTPYYDCIQGDSGLISRLPYECRLFIVAIPFGLVLVFVLATRYR